jgi:hypothetical protein
LLSPEWVGKTAKMLTILKTVIVSANLDYDEVKKQKFCMSLKDRALSIPDMQGWAAETGKVSSPVFVVVLFLVKI